MAITPTNIQNHIAHFITYLQYEKRYSLHSAIAYENDLNQFTAFIHTDHTITDIKEIELMHVRSWLAHLSEQKLSTTTLRRKISALKSFLQYALKKNLISKNPVQLLSLPKKKKPVIDFLNTNEMEKLFTTIPFPNNWEGMTDRLLLETFYTTGMRLSELTFLQENKINFTNRTLIVEGKGGKERLLPLSENLTEKLSDYLQERARKFPTLTFSSFWVNSKGNPLYVKYVYRKVKKYLSFVTTIPSSPHTLRHTFATHLIHEGAAINAIKELLGHSSLAATQMYTHNNISHLKDIYKKAHPKS